ncbi:MAG: phosphoesterase, partial [Myxococcota bacterium]
MSKAFAKILDWDASLLLQIRRLERRWLTPVMRAVTRLGNADMWFALGLTLTAMGGSATEAGLRLGAAAVLGTLLAQILKRACKRERPNLRIEGFTALSENPDHFSFPSGH